MIEPKIAIEELTAPPSVQRFQAGAGDDLQLIYRKRFEETGLDYRGRVWDVLVRDFWQRFVKPTDTVLDLGCGYGEFINRIQAARKFAMDLNPDTARQLGGRVTFLQQDCAQRWMLPNDSLDVVFTSNFFEHLSSKNALDETVREARRCLRPGGRLIAMGPNAARVGGAYWHFWDHHLALTEQSLRELMLLHGLEVEQSLPAFLPYTMVNQPHYPLAFLRVYLRLTWAWRFFGGQFLVVARK